MLTDQADRYGLVTIVLHWLSALAVFFLFGLGVYMVELSYYDPWYHQGPALHISVGLCLLLATLFRLAWRRGGKHPGPISSHGRGTRLAAGAVKVLLYIGLVTILASGYLVTTAKGQRPELFGLLEFPVLLTLSPKGVDWAGWLHRVASWGLLFVVAGHALAALYHQIIHKDGTLARMVKATSKATPKAASEPAAKPVSRLTTEK